LANRFQNVLVALVVVSTVFSVHGQRADITIGTQSEDSRSAVGLLGPVRSVLTVEKRDTGAGYAETLSTIARTYDRNGAAIETLIHHADIGLNSQHLVALDNSSIYVYGPSGQLDKVTHYDPDGSVRGRIEYRYDSAGRLIERSTYAGAKELFDKEVITYPTRWQCLEKRETYHDGRVLPGYQWLSTFNDKGRLIERRTLKPDGSLSERNVYSYDAKGNVKKSEYYDGNNVYRWSHVFSYKFDNRGNWVEKKAVQVLPGRDSKANDSDNDKAPLMTYRVITYFDVTRNPQ